MAKRVGTKTKMNTGIYDSSSNDKKENARLVSQATTIEVFDTNVIKEFLSVIQNSSKKPGETIYILELGGADMKGARISRYNDAVLDSMKNLGYKVVIVNAEYNEKAIKDSAELHGDLFKNVQVDLNENPKESLVNLAKEYAGGKKFDMIFSNYVLQHLQNPQEVMEAVQHVLSKNGLSMHRVPDDRLKVKGFYTENKPNEKANNAAIKIVELFLKTLTKSRTDRKLGGKMFDVCTSGYEGTEGVNYDTVYDRIASEVIPGDSDESTKLMYLERDFRWYMFALQEAGEEAKDPEFAKLCLDAAVECRHQYEILKNEFLNNKTAYHYGEHEIVVTKGLELSYDIEKQKNLDQNRSISYVSAKIHENYYEFQTKEF